MYVSHDCDSSSSPNKYTEEIMHSWKLNPQEICSISWCSFSLTSYTLMHHSFLWQLQHQGPAVSPGWLPTFLQLLPYCVSEATPVLVSSNVTSSNSWILLRGFTCVKQPNFKFDVVEQTDRSNESEDDCVQACSGIAECSAAQWLDFSRLSDTGNQKHCSLYIGYEACNPGSAYYVEISPSWFISPSRISQFSVLFIRERADR